MYMGTTQYLNVFESLESFLIKQGRAMPSDGDAAQYETADEDEVQQFLNPRKSKKPKLRLDPNFFANFKQPKIEHPLYTSFASEYRRSNVL